MEWKGALMHVVLCFAWHLHCDHWGFIFVALEARAYGLGRTMEVVDESGGAVEERPVRRRAYS